MALTLEMSGALGEVGRAFSFLAEKGELRFQLEFSVAEYRA